MPPGQCLYLFLPVPCGVSEPYRNQRCHGLYGLLVWNRYGTGASRWRNRYCGSLRNGRLPKVLDHLPGAQCRCVGLAGICLDREVNHLHSHGASPGQSIGAFGGDDFGWPCRLSTGNSCLPGYCS